MHRPVLLREVLELLQLKPGDKVLDGTVGNGGHAEAILDMIGPKGLLIGLDQDEEALKRSSERLSRFKKQLILKHANFSDLDQVLFSLHIERVNAVLLDIGVSSDQLDDPRRGFSFRHDGPLDMRMDLSRRRSAQDLIRDLKPEELASILFHYGEERLSRRIARAIERVKAEKPIGTTMQLAQIVEQAVPPSYRYGKIHPATRTFQALRIAVNEELREVELVLPKALNVLQTNGKLAVISFHSLEDRMVKRFFLSEFRTGHVRILTKKPVTPQTAEIEENPRSRSAKLRVVERSS